MFRRGQCFRAIIGAETSHFPRRCIAQFAQRNAVAGGSHQIFLSRRAGELPASRALAVSPRTHTYSLLPTPVLCSPPTCFIRRQRDVLCMTSGFGLKKAVCRLCNLDGALRTLFPYSLVSPVLAPVSEPSCKTCVM